MDTTAPDAAELAAELRRVVEQAEALLGAAGEDGDESLEALRERVDASLDAARARLAALEGRASHATQRYALAAEVWVRENPWAAVAVGTGVGLLVGTLLMRRGQRRSEAQPQPQ